MAYRQFSSKLLLFGEYTVLLGSDALAVPFPGFSGSFAFGEEENASSEGVGRLYRHILSIPALSLLFDMDQWRTDIHQGLYFPSNIPFGYGLGSSGALVAAAFDQYCVQKPADISEVKKLLGQMENAFHGASSGMDPLVSYTNHALLFRSNGEIEVPPYFPIPDDMALIDTGIERQTGPLVARFSEKLTSDPAFRMAIESIKTHNQAAIDALITGNFALLKSVFREISLLQLDALGGFIPAPFATLWQDGLENNLFFMKLCGAGGGGMLLVYILQPKGEEFLAKEYTLLKIAK